MARKILSSCYRTEPFIRRQTNLLRTQKVSQSWRRKGYEVDQEWQTLFSSVGSGIAEPFCLSYKRRKLRCDHHAYCLLMPYTLIESLWWAREIQTSIQYRTCAHQEANIQKSVRFVLRARVQGQCLEVTL